MMMAKVLNADIASGFFSKGSFDLRKEWFKWKMISLTSEIFKKWFRHIKLKYSFLFKTKFLIDYDTIIFSWDSISAVRNRNKNQKKIYYCHTPPRYLYDLHELYSNKVHFLIKPFFKLFCFIFKKMYENDIKKMDLILTNSINTQKRIKSFLNLDSKVLYPPVDNESFKFLSTKDYYLSFARLADAKRVDKIVLAFQKMPDKKELIYSLVTNYIYNLYLNMGDLDYLKKKNSHKRDANTFLDEATHIYNINDETDYTSMTTFIHSLFEKFDDNKIIDNMMRSDRWPQNKYYGMTRQEIKTQIEEDVKQSGCDILEVITAMQGILADGADEESLDLLCEIKWDYIETEKLR